MEAAAEASSERGELPLQKILRLEREKRIAAELLVEKERQALLQLKYLLLKRKSNEEPEDKVEDSYASKGPLRRTVSNSSVSTLPRAFSQEFTASVLGELPGDVQQSLELQKLAVSASDDTPFSRAMAAISCHDDRKLLRLLSENGSKQLIAEHGIHLLCTAAKEGATGCTRVLLQSGCDPNLRTPQSPSPILLVAKSGNINVLRILIDHKADVNVVDRLGYCPLYLALQGGRREMVEVLLSANPKMDIMTGYDNSVIHAAVLQDDPILLRMVVVKLRGSCDQDTVRHVINKRNEDGYSPLHQAAAEGYKYCVEVLCACPEVDISLPDFTGKIASDIAPPDCQILLENRLFKEVPVVLETEETSHPKLTVGVVRVLPHHSWSDLKVLVSEQLKDFRNTLRGDMGVAVMGNRRLPTYPISITQSKIPTELRQQLELDSSTLYDNIQSIIDNHINQLSNFELQFSKMEPSLIGRYSLSQEVELESKGQTKKLPFQLIECIEDIGEVVEVKVGISSRTNSLAISSMIPLPILEEYVQMTSRNRLFMVHGPPETDLSFLTYNLIECINMSFSELPHPPVVKEVWIQLHHNFTREDLILTLWENNLLQNVEANSQQLVDHNDSSVILLLEGVERLPDYDLLEDMHLLMASQQETKRGVWLNLSDQSSSSSFVPGKYKLKNVGYLIATRVIHKSGSLPSVIMDNYTHIWLTDSAEPILGKLLRNFLCQLIHVRKGRALSRYDPLYQVLMWVWQFWVLYNHYMELMDLHQLKLGPKMFLSCPIKRNDADHIYNWFLEMWNYHLVPKINDTLLDPEVKLKTKKINRFETARMLLLFLTQRVMQLTCPLYPEGTFNFIKNLYGVGDLQSFTFPTISEESAGDQLSSANGVWRSPKSSKNKFKTSTPIKISSPKIFHKSTGNLQEVSLTPPLSNKKSSLHKPLHRPKSGNLFGRTSTLRRALFKGSRASLYSVEEEGNKRKSKKWKKEQELVQAKQGPDQQQDMEQFFEMLMSSDSSRIDEQRANTSPSSSLPPSHHKISVSPSESSHESVENTPTTDIPKGYYRALSDHDSWVSEESVNKQDAVLGTDIRPLHSRVSILRQPARSRSQSEENVFNPSERRPSLEDILRPSSEVSLHRHEISNSSELLSNSHSSVESSSVGCSVHESVPSFGNQNMAEELDTSSKDGRVSALSEKDLEKGGESLDVTVSPESSGLASAKKNSKTLAFYSATLGLTMKAPNRPTRTSVPAFSQQVEPYKVVSGRKLSTPSIMMTWMEDESVEM